MIEILTTGVLNTVQDLGRPGQLARGIAPGGAMDRSALSLANALLGNQPGAAAIEVAFFPFRLRFKAPMNMAVTGADSMPTLDGYSLPPSWALPAKAGQVLELSRPIRGARSYVAVGGGIDVPVVLGSRSTDAKTGFGGSGGNGMERGACLAVFPDASLLPPAGFGVLADPGLPKTDEDLELRVLPAAETARFDPEAIERFRGETWSLTPEANRMGLRLQGPGLKLVRPLELLSHGIVPGTVQVPPAGQPIIQMADGNTCGGYPKIATVIEADLHLLAQAPIGTRLRFTEVGWVEAQNASIERTAFLADATRTLKLLRSSRT